MSSLPARLTFRRYEPADESAVWTLHEWAMRDAGTDPDDVPGTADLRDIETAYLNTGGDFVVGILDSERALPSSTPRDSVPRTADGPVVAIGGFMPSEAGHEDERTVPGAAELHRMRVLPPLQGAGIGKRLLDELERRAEAAGFELALATTASRQRNAVEFYPAAGYSEVARSMMGEYELVHFQKPLQPVESCD